MFNDGFDGLVDSSIDLCPSDLRADIDALNDRVYPQLNNGVYRAGFATTQLATSTTSEWPSRLNSASRLTPSFLPVSGYAPSIR